MLCLHLSRCLARTCPGAAVAVAACAARSFSDQSQERNLKFRKATHCIFDLDGLLLDTESIYQRAFVDVAKSYGKKYTHELQMKHMGTPCEIGCRIIINELQIPATFDEFEHRFHDIAHQFLGDCQLMPGAEQIIDHLKKHNIPIAIATSSQEPGFSIKTKKHKQFLSAFSHVVVSANDPEVKRGKPFPDVYLVCASRFKDKPRPEECLAFEDSPNGCSAAIAADMHCVIVPDSTVPKDLCKHATLICQSLTDVPLEKFGLPPL